MLAVLTGCGNSKQPQAGAASTTAGSGAGSGASAPATGSGTAAPTTGAGTTATGTSAPTAPTTGTSAPGTSTTSASQYPDLQTAIDNTPSGGTLLVQNRQYNLTSQVVISKPITIQCDQASVITDGTTGSAPSGSLPGAYKNNSSTIVVDSPSVKFYGCTLDENNNLSRRGYFGMLGVGLRPGAGVNPQLTTPNGFEFRNGQILNVVNHGIDIYGGSDIYVTNNVATSATNTPTTKGSGGNTYPIPEDWIQIRTDGDPVSGFGTGEMHNITVEDNDVQGQAAIFIGVTSGYHKADYGMTNVSFTGNKILLKGSWNDSSTPAGFFGGDFGPREAGYLDYMTGVTISNNTVTAAGTSGSRYPETGTGVGYTVWDFVTDSPMYNATITNNVVDFSGQVIDSDFMELFCYGCTVTGNQFTGTGITNDLMPAVNSHGSANIEGNTFNGWGKNAQGINWYPTSPDGNGQSETDVPGVQITGNTLNQTNGPRTSTTGQMAAITADCNISGPVDMTGANISTNNISLQGSANETTAPDYAIGVYSAAASIPTSTCHLNGMTVVGNTVSYKTDGGPAQPFRFFGVSTDTYTFGTQSGTAANLGAYETNSTAPGPPRIVSTGSASTTG